MVSGPVRSEITRVQPNIHLITRGEISRAGFKSSDKTTFGWRGAERVPACHWHYKTLFQRRPRRPQDRVFSVIVRRHLTIVMERRCVAVFRQSFGLSFALFFHLSYSDFTLRMTDSVSASCVLAASPVALLTYCSLPALCQDFSAMRGVPPGSRLFSSCSCWCWHDLFWNASEMKTSRPCLFVWGNPLQCSRKFYLSHIFFLSSRHLPPSYSSSSTCCSASSFSRSTVTFLFIPR